MSKELEALEKIKQARYLVDFELDVKVGEDYKEELAIIEKALKDYELMNQTKIIVIDKKISDDDLEKLKNQRILIGSSEESKVELLFDEKTRKKLKALEIIKNKFVWVENGKLYAGVQCDIETELNREDFDSKEEYDLLKEVFDE